MNMEKIKELLKEIKPADIVIVVGIVIAMLVGMLTFYHFRGTADKKIEATATLGFQVFIRGVTLTGNEVPIKAGDETFITIRNVPYTNLKVLDAKIDTKKLVVPNPRRGKDDFLVIDDSSQPFLYDMIVTLVVNDAKITKDGAVAGGNKIKIGLPVTLEGASYKINGTVSDVRILQPDTKADSAQEDVKPDVNKQDADNVG